MRPDTFMLLVSLGLIAGLAAIFYWGIRRYLKDMKVIKENYKNKKPKKVEEIPVQKPQSTLATIGWSIAGYWVIFAGIIHWISGDDTVSDSTVMAPIVLPFVWIWGILSSDTFWYIIGAWAILWYLQQVILKPLHDKLDRILQKLQ